MPATSAVFLVESIGIPFAGGFVAGVRTVLAMSVSFRETAALPGLGGGRPGMAGVEVIDRDQGHADVADLLEQAVQCGLVDQLAAQHGGAVLLVREGEPVEPGGPAGVEVPGQADLVPARLRPATSRWGRSAHGTSVARGVRRRGLR